jgi:short subunit dehydrogenase-like uncharacterized protein
LDPVTTERNDAVRRRQFCRGGVRLERNHHDLRVWLHRQLIAKAAVARGVRPILAGRNLDKVKAVADPLGLTARAFDRSEPARIDAAIKDISALLCAAGPFSATSRPAADACLRNRVHYLDVTGEIDVFEALAARDAEAETRGVTLLPGVGFDVVPSDCLAAHLKRRLPDAKDLKLYLSLGANMSRGTGKTMIEAIGAGTRLRRKGRIVSRDRAERGRAISEKARSRRSRSVGATSRLRFIRPAFPTSRFNSRRCRRSERSPARLGSSSHSSDWTSCKASSRRALTACQRGSEAARGAGRAVLVGVARNENGQTVRSRLRTPEGYTLTAETAFDAAQRVAAGEVKPGFQTPSLAFDADYILNFDGVTREDLNS